MENINWYPGHMKKTRELIQENLKLVDAVIEVIDARIPISSRNPIVDQLVQGKPRIIALNKSDLADERANAAWREYFAAGGMKAVSMNCVSGTGVRELFRVLEEMSAEKNRGRAMQRPFRIMIVGVPNVGKSSLINRMTGRKSAQTGDRPGVTRGKQWLKLKNGMQLLDTPGILWPKFEDPDTGKCLAFCGAIKDEILDVPTLAMELIGTLAENCPQMLAERYKLSEIAETPLENMEEIAVKRGCILPGKRIDYERIGRLVLDEFRNARIGRITLEFPGEAGETGSGKHDSAGSDKRNGADGEKHDSAGGGKNDGADDNMRGE